MLMSDKNMYGWLVRMKNCDRLGVIKHVDDKNIWEVKLLSGSWVIAHGDFFEVVTGNPGKGKKNGN